MILILGCILCNIKQTVVLCPYTAVHEFLCVKCSYLWYFSCFFSPPIVCVYVIILCFWLLNNITILYLSTTCISDYICILPAWLRDQNVSTNIEREKMIRETVYINFMRETSRKFHAESIHHARKTSRKKSRNSSKITVM